MLVSQSAVIRYVASIGEFLRLVLDVFGVTLRRPPKWHLIREQLFNIGVLSLPVITFTGFSIGMVLAAIYFVLIYRLFRGKVSLEDDGY